MGSEGQKSVEFEIRPKEAIPEEQKGRGHQPVLRRKRLSRRRSVDEEGGNRGV